MIQNKSRHPGAQDKLDAAKALLEASRVAFAAEGRKAKMKMIEIETSSKQDENKNE